MAQTDTKVSLDMGIPKLGTKAESVFLLRCYMQITQLLKDVDLSQYMHMITQII